MYKVDSVSRVLNPALGFLSLSQTSSSRIPEVYQEVMNLAGISGSYKCFTTTPKKLEESLQSFIDFDLNGVNIGPPYQTDIIPLLATLSEGANMIGAVNTIVRHGLFFKGYNTNSLALMDALTASGLKTARCTSALILGSGGAARSALFLLHWLGVPEITIAGRTLTKTEDTTLHIGGGDPTLLESALQQTISTDIVINATSASAPLEDPELTKLISRMPLTGCQMVVDFNYDQDNNVWHDLARKQACPFLDGLTLLAYQARHALILWTGKQIPLKVISKALQKINHPLP